MTQKLLPTMAEAISTAATTAGWPQRAVFALVLDRSIVDRASLDAALATAAEVRSLCRVARFHGPDAPTPEALAADFVASRTPIARVRSLLCQWLAEDDEANHTDSARPTDPADRMLGDIWARRGGATR